MAALPRLSTGDGFPNVVVTGYAMTTALATDADTTWQRLLDGQSGIRLLDDPFVEQYNLPVRIGGHLLEDFEKELTRVELRRLSGRVGRRGHRRPGLGARRVTRGRPPAPDGVHRHRHGLDRGIALRL